MAQLRDKYTEIKTLVNQEYYTQAKGECDNALGMCDSARVDFENMKSKLIDKFGDDELFDDFEAFINSYL